MVAETEPKASKRRHFTCSATSWGYVVFEPIALYKLGKDSPKPTRRLFLGETTHKWGKVPKPGLGTPCKLGRHGRYAFRVLHKGKLGPRRDQGPGDGGWVRRKWSKKRIPGFLVDHAWGERPFKGRPGRHGGWPGILTTGHGDFGGHWLACRGGEGSPRSHWQAHRSRGN